MVLTKLVDDVLLGRVRDYLVPLQCAAKPLVHPCAAANFFAHKWYIVLSTALFARKPSHKRPRCQCCTYAADEELASQPASASRRQLGQQVCTPSTPHVHRLASCRPEPERGIDAWMPTSGRKASTAQASTSSARRNIVCTVDRWFCSAGTESHCCNTIFATSGVVQEESQTHHKE